MGKFKRANPEATTSIRDVKIEPIPGGLKNGPVDCKPKRLPVVRPSYPELHGLMGFIGHIGSGKTNAATNLIQAYWDDKSINRIFVISPTYDSNAQVQTLPIEMDDVYTSSESAEFSLQEVIRKVGVMVMDYDFEIEYKKAYKAWCGKDQFGQYLDMTTADQKALLHKEHFRAPKDIPWPSPLLFIDDMANTILMQNSITNMLTHLSLKHRHLAGVGITIIMAVQSFKRGLPASIRANLTQCLLFETINMKELEDMHFELANGLSFETFKKYMYLAFNEPHGFLMINKKAKDKNKQFTINFDRAFITDLEGERRKVLRIE